MEDKVERVIRNTFFIYVFFSLSLISSCSYLSRKKNDPLESASNTQVTSDTPKADRELKNEYLELKKKYDALKKKSAVTSVDGQDESLANQTMDTKVELNKRHSVVNAADNKSMNDILNETVNVFNDEKNSDLKSSPQIDNAIDKLPMNLVALDEKESIVLPSTVDDQRLADNIENEIYDYQKGMELLAKNQFDPALALFKKLTKSTTPQVEAFARYQIGVVFFKQQEYDLAMQIFKQVIANNAYSGVIYKALDKLVYCCDKLQLTQEKEIYYSLLHDLLKV